MRCAKRFQADSKSFQESGDTMVQLKIISVGTVKEGYLREAIAEYKKRLSQFARVEEAQIKEEIIKDEDNAREIEAALLREGEKIIKAIPDGAFKIALCIEGGAYSSEEFAKIISNAADASGKICFIIGSSHGLSNEVKRIADLKLSFSKMTFPHQLMQVILSESIYRAFTIIAGKRYHK